MAVCAALIFAVVLSFASESRADPQYASTIYARLKLNRVAHWVTYAAAPLCGNRVRSDFGFVATNAHDVPARARASAGVVLGVSDWASIVDIVPGSPAARAGLRQYDIIRAANGRIIPVGKRAIPRLKNAMATAGSGWPTRFDISRGKRRLNIDVTGVRVCDYPVVEMSGGQVNAYAYADNIPIPDGMYRFINNDADQLGFVIAHELAHNVLKHTEQKRDAAIAGALAGMLFDLGAAAAGVRTDATFTRLGAVLAMQSYSRESEAEADYFALYAMALGGFDLQKAVVLAQRLSRQQPNQPVTYVSSHPAWPQRVSIVQRTIQEIRRKQAAGQPLQPNLVERKPRVPTFGR